MSYQESIQQIIQKAEGNKRGGGFLYVFLLGAGASVSSHIPVGQTMCEKLKKEYGIDESKIEKNRSKGMTAYQATLNLAMKQAHPKFISQYIREMILSSARRPKPDYKWIISNCYNTLANILIERSYFSRAVFTTNFDPLLYYAFIQNWNIEPILIRHYEELETMLPEQVHSEFPCLIYLHGYWQNHHLYHEPSQLKRYSDEWVHRLLGWLEHDIIVVGYSGIEDSIALEWLRKCLKKGNTVWWCLYSPNGTLDDSQCHSIESNLSVSGGDLRFIPIKNADQFVLDLGKELGLKQAKEVSCLCSIIPWFYPNGITHFANGASLRYETDNDFVVEFQMGKDTLPGNNHAGINIDSVEHELDISQYKKITVQYILLSKKSALNNPSFEFKLHSKKNAWSYHVPIVSQGHNSHMITLDRFVENGVNLKKIWRIVIASDVNCLGRDGQAKIAISNISLSH